MLYFILILIAVIVGYLLGIAPYIIPKVIEIKQTRVKQNETVQEKREAEEILNEYLNGPIKSNGINQEDIAKEFITGERTTKGE